MVSAKIRGRVLVRLTGGSQPICDYIDYEDELWFVPEYIKDANQKDTKKPARIISLSDLSEKRNPPPNVPADIEIVQELNLALFYHGQRTSFHPRVIPEPDIEIETD